MKKLINIAALCILGAILASCTGSSGSLGQLTRVDIQMINKEERIITNQKDIEKIKKTLENVSWEPNAEPKMARKEDLIVTLFYEYDKNMPEKLYEYQIWFNKNETITINSTNEKEGFGTLDEKNSQVLKNALIEEK